MTPDTCLTPAQWRDALGALRPRGDAWRNGAFDQLDGSVMGDVLAGAAEGFAATNARLCALVEEFFCSTARETRDIWAAEYGMPDPCDPFADLCEKVNAVGDSTTGYVKAAAARRGWAIEIREEWTVRAEVARAGMARAGAAICGSATGITWFIAIDSAASSAFLSPRFKVARAGRMRSGRGLACPPDIEPLKCLIRRISPAHADLVFSVI
jgi:uncharacterized protein YmfQ (DUF2313 family)